MQVIALIGDLRASRRLPQRPAFQRKLAKVLAQTTRDARRLASPFTLTLGDEFQAVYRGAGSVLVDVINVMAEIHPVRARFALGVGELSTRINPTQALGMDGPAFHQARATLNALKDDGRLLRIAGARAETWALPNHVLNLLSHQIERWSSNRLRILAGLLEERGIPEIEAALGISRVAVYKNIRAAALDDVVAICHELTAAMDRELRTK